MHLLACSVFALLLVQMSVGIGVDVDEDEDNKLSRCDPYCRRSYYSKIIPLKSIYPNCTVNVGGCHPYRCGICRKNKQRCVPKKRKVRQWCGPGDYKTVVVVKKCVCEPT